MAKSAIQLAKDWYDKLTGPKPVKVNGYLSPTYNPNTANDNRNVYNQTTGAKINRNYVQPVKRKIIDPLRTKLQQAELARISAARSYNTGKVRNPVANLAYFTGRQIRRDVPQIASSVARISPPGMAYQSLANFGNPQKYQQQGRQMLTDTYQGLKGVGYLTAGVPTLAAGGGIGVGMNAVGNVWNGRPAMKNYGQAFGTGVSEGAALSTLSKLNPIRVKGGMNIPKTIGGYGIKEGVEGAVQGSIRPLQPGETRLQAVANEAIFGALFGGLTQGVPAVIKNKLNPQSQQELRQILSEPIRNKVGQLIDPNTKQYVKAVKNKIASWAGVPGKLSPEDDKRLTELVKKGMAKLGDQQGFIKPSEFVPGKKAEVPTRERGFISSVKADKTTPEAVKSQIKGEYPIQTNKATMKKATKLLDANPDQAVQNALTGEASAVNNAVVMTAIKRHIDSGNTNAAVDLVEKFAANPTSQGQAIQILSAWGRLGPEGALNAAQRLVNKANVGKTPNAQIKLPGGTAKEITDLAKKVQKMPEGRGKAIATAELVDKIHSVVPPNLLKKISTIQTLSQLLNPKTTIRNIGGNAVFAGAENVSQAVATPIDMATSLVTGKRTTALPNLGTQFKGFKLGLKEGLEEALKGVDTQGMGKQFDLPTGTTFKGKYSSLPEKGLSVLLKTPDRAFYNAAYQDSLATQMKLAKTNTPTPQMEEAARAVGLYRTFQDNSTVARVFSGLKKSLNLGKDWGVGDIVLKYPKTPGNILARGIDYSPAGFVKTVFELGKPLIGREFNQKAFVDNMSRATVGTAGIVTTGMLLHKLGIITGKPQKDKDIAAVQKTEGLGQYQVNTSALKRFILSGFDPNSTKQQEGDVLATYDWMQPTAIGLSMGANIDENKGEATGMVASILSSLQGGTETLTNQPLVQGFTRLFQGYSPSEAFANSMKGVPGSFVPTAVSQVNQLTNNTTRNTYDPNYFKETLNITKNKIPGLAQTLPTKYDVLGQPMERYQAGSNSVFNVFLNPAFISKVNENPAAKEVLSIYENSGQTKQAPRVVPKKIKVNGQEMPLTGQQQSAYQQYVGTISKKIFDKLASDPRFVNAGDEQKAQYMANILSDINSAAKIVLFGDRPKKPSKSSIQLAKMTWGARNIQ